MGRRPLPAVRDLSDGRWRTNDVSVLKKIGRKMRMRIDRTPSKATITNKLARLGHFPPGSQAGRLDGPVFLLYVFSLVRKTDIFSKHGTLHPEYLCVQAGDHMAAPTVEQVIRTNR